MIDIKKMTKYEGNKKLKFLKLPDLPCNAPHYIRSFYYLNNSENVWRGEQNNLPNSGIVNLQMTVTIVRVTKC